VTQPTDAFTVFAPAKINLSLHVVGKRPDGYHELESLVVFAGVGDTLHFAPADQLTLSVEGLNAETLGGDDNLVLKAAHAFTGRTGQQIGASIRLEKRLLMAAGLGGGSADAAAALRGFAKLYPKAATAEQLLDIAADVGSDVPVCLQSRPAMMLGRGERVEPLATALPLLHILLVNPRVAVSTAEAYAGVKTYSAKGSAPQAFDLSGVEPLVRYLRTTRNDLEKPARAIAPIIADALDELARMPGILLSRMSGSGATCFGIFESAFEAEMAATAISHSHPDWWVVPTVVGTRQ
jgi:4-diphosphocytidyl-2-C-methyl-D-erythritol kinase